MIASAIIAHRGLSSLYPENTLIALRSASKVGATWVEMDVQIASDGTPVIIHDLEISRTTDSDGYIADKTGAEIAGLDAGAWFGEQFAGERVPTLADVLAELDFLNMGLNLEIKYDAKVQGVLSAREVEHTVDSVLTGLKLGPRPPPWNDYFKFLSPFSSGDTRTAGKAHY